MGIYGALSTAVSGLSAQSFALEHISGNIANSQTTGFKRLETDFIDLVPESALDRQSTGAVLAKSRQTNSERGDVKASSNETYMALNDNSFFIVEEKVGQSDGQAIFGGGSYYTRRGDFDIDNEGYLVNGAGFYLKGLPIDAQTGNVAGSVPEVIQISNAFLPAEQTTRIDYQLNLPELPQTASYDESVADSELMSVVAAGDNVTGADEVSFLEQSIAGGAITAYAPNGAPANVQIRWAKVDSYNSGGTDTWNMYYLSDSNAGATDDMWINVGQDYVFGTDGSLSPAINEVTITGMEVNGLALADITLQHSTNGVSQFSDPNGQSEVTTMAQNGYPAGEFTSLSVNSNGRILATYSNGQAVELAAVATANFNAPNMLQRADGGIYSATSESGEPIVGTDAGIFGAALEASNTDISEEFTKLIVTQQAYAAGTRIVSTSDEMLQEALNMVR